MQYTQIGVLILAIVAAGCSSETSSSPANPETSSTASAEVSDVNSADDTESTSVKSSPNYEAVIVINAAKKGDDGPICTSDMAAQGKSECGPVLSLTKLSWEFIEHRDGADYYRFNWSLTSDGDPKNSKSLTVGFDGATEAIVIDAEHYIVVRKGPLRSDTEPAK